ncbi:hypothetical protein JW992_15910 [candidate division KSB1 bacterium]|nr:hypothetical protein [candidate division KSB1 bacterium]
MTHRERALSILNFQSVDQMPVVHFGFWPETVQKWAAEGHVRPELAKDFYYRTEEEAEVGGLLGFDFGWAHMLKVNTRLFPPFEEKVVRNLPDGSYHIQNQDGVILLGRPDAGSIPSEIEHLLKDRSSWETHYRHRLKWSDDRVDKPELVAMAANRPDTPFGLFCGSLYGVVRDILGLEGSCYLQVDDEPLFDEIIDTVADLCYQNVDYQLKTGVHFDYAHFWEDICYKNGPLISPAVFAKKISPHYRRITDLLHANGIDIISLDCDGKIDALLPIWLENGVNTMFPIEVGTWKASIGPWRELYGRKVLGVGGVNKTIFSRDRAAVDAEIERLKALVDLGGYIPCPDHRIPPDARWELVQYYCDTVRRSFF